VAWVGGHFGRWLFLESDALSFMLGIFYGAIFPLYGAFVGDYFPGP
jgi:hypothetical protein